jgi:hypothetical protein
MNSQVVKCWNCGREFEVMLERKPREPVYRGLKSNDATNRAPSGKGKGVELARPCPFPDCGKINMIVIKEG